MKLTSRLVVGALLLAGPAVFAQSPTATANTTATILTAISLASTADLAFGNVATGTSASTVIMSTAGSRSIGGGNAALVGGTSSAAGFTTTGSGTQTYTITLPGSASTLSDGAAHTMTVDTFTSSLGATGTLTAGTQNFTVGGTLHVGASQVAGSYTGTFDVTVAYN